MDRHKLKMTRLQLGLLEKQQKELERANRELNFKLAWLTISAVLMWILVIGITMRIVK